MHQIHYHQLRPHLLTVVTVPLIGRPRFPPPLTTRDPILHDDVKGHQQQLSLNRREESTFFHTMFKLEIFLAFYTVGQAFFGLAMFACIGYLVWICRREDGETLNPLSPPPWPVGRERQTCPLDYGKPRGRHSTGKMKDIVVLLACTAFNCLHNAAVYQLVIFLVSFSCQCY